MPGSSSLHRRAWYLMRGVCADMLHLFFTKHCTVHYNHTLLFRCNFANLKCGVMPSLKRRGFLFCDELLSWTSSFIMLTEAGRVWDAGLGFFLFVFVLQFPWASQSLTFEWMWSDTHSWQDCSIVTHLNVPDHTDQMLAAPACYLHS